MRGLLTSLLQVVSAGAAVYGLSLVWSPLGWIAGGVVGLVLGHELDADR